MWGEAIRLFYSLYMGTKLIQAGQRRTARVDFKAGMLLYSVGMEAHD